ncbi:MAG: efflux RND transporter periplasmic adaptor subunit [Pseudomonadota bacterium]
MRFFRQSLIGIFLAALTFGLLIYAGQIVRDAFETRMANQSAKPPARERVFTVNVVTAETVDIAPLLESFGEIRSRRTLEVRASASGRVIELSDAFEDGGNVQTGDVLLQIDPADAQAALDRARTDLADAEAEIRDADRMIVLARDEVAAAEEQAELRERAYRRQVDLAGRGVGTSASVEASELSASAARQAVLSSRQAFAQAEARVDQAQTQRQRAAIALSEAARALADTTVTAPFDGTLSAADLVQGRLVTANEKLADLIDPDELEVSFRLSTAQYARLLDADGRLIEAPVEVTLVVAGIDLIATGTITRARAAVGEGQTGRVVFARLDRAPGFKPGDFVTIRASEPTVREVVRLPASTYQGTGNVLVVNGDNRLETLDVTLVRRQGNDILVRGEDLDGQNVVTARSPLLSSGISVRMLRPEGTQEDLSEMLELSEERRARLVAFIEANTRMPAEAKARVLARLNEPSVPAQMVARIESQMGS